MKLFRLALALSILAAGCAVAGVDPCYGRSDSTECNLYRSQLNATLQASESTRIAEGTRAANDRVIEATRQASEIQQAQALANAGATATIEAAQAQADIDRANAQATLIAATIESQRAASDATSTAVANNIVISNQNLAGTATAQAAKDASDLAHARAENDLNLAKLGGFVENALKLIFGLAVIGFGAYALIRLMNEAWQWFREWRGVHAKKVDVGDGRSALYDQKNNKVIDPRMAITPVVDLNTDGVSGIPREILELLIAFKRVVDTAEIYRTMARHQVDADDAGVGDDGTWQQVPPVPLAQIGPVGDDVKRLPSAPAFAELIHSWRPTPERMILAYGADGPIYGRISDLLSTGIIGRQNQGKTSLLRFIYAQCLMIGVEAVLWDLHADVVKKLPGVRAFVTVEDIEASAVAMLAGLDARVRGDRRDETPIMIMSDEFNTVATACPTTIDVCRRIIWEGRKFQIYCMLSAKGLPAALFGESGSTVRDSLSSHFAFRTSVRQASQLGFDVELARAVPDLAPGQALFDGPVDPQVVTFPLTTIEDVKGLLPASKAASAASGSGFGSGDGSGLAVGDEAALEVANEAVDPVLRERVRQLLLERKPSSQIIKEVWGVSGGSSYTKAASELSQIVAALISRQTNQVSYEAH